MTSSDQQYNEGIESVTMPMAQRYYDEMETDATHLSEVQGVCYIRSARVFVVHISVAQEEHFFAVCLPLLPITPILPILPIYSRE